MKCLIALALLSVLVLSVQCQDPLKAKVLCIIETLSSNACKNTARSQANTNSDPATACGTLETFKLLLPLVGCTHDDYQKLHSVICEHIDVPCTPA